MCIKHVNYLISFRLTEKLSMILVYVKKRMILFNNL